MRLCAGRDSRHSSSKEIVHGPPGTPVGGVATADTVEHGGFSRTVGTDKGRDRPLLHGEGYPHKGSDALEGECYVTDVEVSHNPAIMVENTPGAKDVRMAER